MKKILALTGIRSEYDILYPILKEFERQDFNVCVAISNAHLSDIHGNTYQKIEQDGFKIADKIDCLLNTDRVTQRSKGTGLLIAGFTQCVERENPDFIIVLGDREESIAACIVGNYMDVLTIHCGGGDPVYGNSDDTIRFACSKLAHIHFTTAKEYADNLIKIGEDKWRIICSGNTSYTNISNVKKKTRKELSSIIGIDIENNEYFMLLKHPLSSEINDSYKQMKITMEACLQFAKDNNLNIIGIYPNTDPGSYKIIEVINEYENKYENIKFFKTLNREIFVNLVRNTLCLAGNSSMGILEAPFYKLPVVNIGNRQKGRLNAGNVEFVDHNHEDIIKSLHKACFDINYRKYIATLHNPYGDETASKKIVDFIKNIDLNDRKWYVKTKLC